MAGQELLRLHRRLNPISRYLMRIGTVIVLLLYIKAGVTALGAGFVQDYYEGMFLCGELLYCAKECVGAIYIPALLFELMRLLVQKDER